MAIEQVNGTDTVSVQITRVQVGINPDVKMPLLRN